MKVMSTYINIWFSSATTPHDHVTTVVHIQQSKKNYIINKIRTFLHYLTRQRATNTSRIAQLVGQKIVIRAPGFNPLLGQAKVTCKQ